MRLVASIAICLESETVDFADIFRELLELNSLTHEAFADRVGVTAPFVSQIASRKRNLPLDRAEEWAAEFELSDSVKRKFLFYAGIAHIRDAPIRNAIAAEFEALSAKVAELTERVRRLR